MALLAGLGTTPSMQEQVTGGRPDVWQPSKRDFAMVANLSKVAQRRQFLLWPMSKKDGELDANKIKYNACKSWDDLDAFWTKQEEGSILILESTG